jgi:hypothetical protein
VDHIESLRVYPPWGERTDAEFGRSNLRDAAPVVSAQGSVANAESRSSTIGPINA